MVIPTTNECTKPSCTIHTRTAMTARPAGPAYTGCLSLMNLR